MILGIIVVLGDVYKAQARLLEVSKQTSGKSQAVCDKL